ncbi:MAG: bifunctional diaminohydroxyphosphoribosylaminopyrimidine deaminase/5-amino-6-(5-phosphoribosylamino)uracil reductase RibD [Hyphomicrobiales bacterium]
MAECDARWMEHALRLGRRTLGATGSNPAVGCVIVADGKLVGAGWTGTGGRPHAERGAIAMAGAAARGATAFVSLEPCSHHGRTAPCADALIAAGVARVVTGLEDPDPRVAGRGHAALKAAGIAVETGLMADHARRDLAGYLARNIKKRPYVVLKLAVSSDGKIAASAGAPTAITGEEARNRVHAVRAESDAILVGVSTVLADDPDLTCRLPGLEDRSPVRVVSDSRASLPPDSRLARSAEAVPVWLLTLAEAAPALTEPGVVFIGCAATGDRKVDLADALRRLAERGINRVLAEGGARMARALVEADLVDEVHLLSASKQLGAAGLDALAGLPLSAITDSDGLRLAGTEWLGEDLLSVYERAHEKFTARPREGGDPEM